MNRDLEKARKYIKVYKGRMTQAVDANALWQKALLGLTFIVNMLAPLMVFHRSEAVLAT